MKEYNVCKCCNKEYDYNKSANFIVFCPHCHFYDYLECEYGFGPVVPCTILLGSEVIGKVSYHDQNQRQYRLDSTYFDLHKVLQHTYLEAIEEARDCIATCLHTSIK